MKLLEHTIKIFERVIEQKIWEVVDKDAIQFRFMPGKSTMFAIFMEVIKWSMRKIGVMNG